MKLLRWIIAHLLKLYYNRTDFLSFSVDCGDDLTFFIESQEFTSNTSRYGHKLEKISEMTPAEAYQLMTSGEGLEKAYIYDPQTHKLVTICYLNTPSQNTNHNEHERSDA